MQTTFKNLCYRCGKERKISRIWKEHMGGSIIYNSESVCPDDECQDVVNKEIARQRTRRLELEERHQHMSRKKKLKVKIKQRG